ncbi:DUF262 domain-containing protein [Xanthomonas phaseoli pv. phaseoli]|uniref:DUF262 domain-containing protein n=2 Tax=Xanthomonas TaxID=338 RepID=UPI001F1B5D02|nr:MULTISPECIES: DUF262 domain-containing protein [Xanthomonas]UZB12165.1 DUF262 domain-containing protein [Xanthomonas phaseoli pv. phaseoli]UZB16318.1 DUF262 domain-containing protein [Xanthomonas phaseoli pv. phaseoli]UZB20472.1 DUF262 domain-containing protein [Xanthomonas phaseoli pv. phaseoli]UZB24761.1 DUF262 domain-containing protein [Xanthomonas phaseoli pv. phaseoli]UZB28551.1 DUF262 domain-containing protein [Xanthomonas phaseoli pv. phaseoli]
MQMADTDFLDREIRTTAVDFSFGELLNLHNTKEIVIRPEYQRLFRWTIEQRSRLIESIVLGLPIPPIFLIEGQSGILELIDDCREQVPSCSFWITPLLTSQNLGLQVAT